MHVDNENAAPDRETDPRQWVWRDEDGGWSRLYDGDGSGVAAPVLLLRLGPASENGIRQCRLYGPALVWDRASHMRMEGVYFRPGHSTNDDYVRSDVAFCLQEAWEVSTDIEGVLEETALQGCEITLNGIWVLTQLEKAMRRRRPDDYVPGSFGYADRRNRLPEISQARAVMAARAMLEDRPELFASFRERVSAVIYDELSADPAFAVLAGLDPEPPAADSRPATD